MPKIQNDATESEEKEKQLRPYSESDLVTAVELSKRLKIRLEDTYLLASTPGFPIYNLGGPNRNRFIWGDVLNWIRANKSVVA